MGQTDPEYDLTLPEIDQIAFVVEDVDEWIECLADVVGVKPWKVFKADPSNTTDGTYRGEPAEFSMYLAHAHVGDTFIELIEPLGGPTIYQDFLDEHGEGFHHFGVFSWEKEETYEIVEQMEAAGMPVIQSANYGGAEFWYFDTAEELNGIFLETAVRHQPVDEARTPEYTYPEQ